MRDYPGQKELSVMKLLQIFLKIWVKFYKALQVLSPVIDTVIETKSALLNSPVTKAVVDTKLNALKAGIKLVEPIIEAVPELLKGALCNLLCPILGTEQCKIDHCEDYEAEDGGDEEDFTGIEPCTKEVKDADDDTV